ncbi:MAG: S41 family peptidase [Nitrospinae bacterium]|nr:S41 family peptidase [Nitrospinota bacterium]
MASKIKGKLVYINLLILLAASLFLGFSGSSKVMAVGAAYESLKNFSEVLSLVQKNYVTEVNTDTLIQGAINGMLRELDPHTSYMPREAYKEMQVETEGKFGGLGIEISIKDDLLTVVSPIEDTPAYNAGIKAGDKILKVDGQSTKDMSLIEAVKKLRGEPGSNVTITVIREDFQAPKDFTITRAIIQIKSVKTKKIDPDVAYIRIRSFTKTTNSELDEALASAAKQKGGIKGLILDLRNNPGGLLNQAVEVSERFLEKGKLVVYTKGRIKEQDMRFVSEGANARTDFPMVILVNAGSASASEIVAGALQDLQRALVVGTQTFGKGSVQTIIPLSDGAGLRLTTARYYTPSGTIIQEKGITPDIVIENILEPAKTEKEEKEDTKFKAIREKDLDQHLKGEAAKEKADKTEQEKSVTGESLEAIDSRDVQLQRAVGLLKGVAIFKDKLFSPKKAG